MTHDLPRLYAAIEATWPAADTRRLGPWMLRDGQGGGKRVSAATLDDSSTETDASAAEEAMQAAGQDPLFMVQVGQDALDAHLADKGYEVVDPVNLYYGSLVGMAEARPLRARVFTIWPPLEIQKDIWAAGDIGPARLDVMHRAKGDKTAIFGRYDNSPAGTAFVAIHDGIAMVHAMEVLSDHRKLGVGRMMTEHAARWARAAGATHVAVLCTKANAGGNALYASMGLKVVGEYHYRHLRGT
ncbi:MAG: GNAT family N-acetyltransferase [Pseudomonadota bacterium]